MDNVMRPLGYGPVEEVEEGPIEEVEEVEEEAKKVWVKNHWE